MTSTKPVHLSVPSDAEYLGVVRLLASSIASMSNIEIDQLEDLRVGVSEIASALMFSPNDGLIELAFWTNADGQFEGTATTRSDRVPSIDGLGIQILNSLLDHYEFALEDRIVTATFSKSLKQIADAE